MEEMNRKNFWRDKCVFVTGANGFLGSWLCKKLVELKSSVVGLVRDWDANSYLNLCGASQSMKIVHGNLEDFHAMERILNEYEIDTCFHLGAQAIVTVANRFPFSTFESNMRGTWNILESVKRTPKVKRLIVASSDKAYGSKAKQPYSESDPLEGTNPYDFSKVCTDMMSQIYCKFYQVPAIIARCGNLYGPGDLNFDRIVPGTIRSLVLNKEPVIRSDGTYLRDYFYIEDAVDGYLVLAERLEEFKGEAFNLGTETPTSVSDLVRRITAISGKKNLKPKILNIATGEIKEQYLSCKKARKLLGWKSRTALSDALKTTYRWYQEILEKTG